MTSNVIFKAQNDINRERNLSHNSRLRYKKIHITSVVDPSVDFRKGNFFYELQNLVRIFRFFGKILKNLMTFFVPLIFFLF